MLVNLAEHDESAVFSYGQDNQVEQTGPTGLFRGRQMAVAQNARLNHDGSPPALQRTSGRNKRKISSSHDANALQGRTAVQFKERLRVLLDDSFNHSLNNDFSRLIHEDRDTNQILVRLANADGVFKHGFSVKADKSLSYGEQHDPNLLFVPCHSGDAGYVLAVYEENSNSVGGREPQWLTRDDLFSHQPPNKHDYPQANCISRLTLSGDSASLVCLDNERGGAIIGRGAKGEWVNKGNCMRYDHLLFSADSNHVAMTYHDRLCLMSKGVDGVWTNTGGIDFGFGRWEMAFSPDNHHFIVWFQETGEHCNECSEYARKDFFVTLFALDDHYQWAEKKRIVKSAQQPTDRFTLQARFSPDGKHLLVCAPDEFDIWALGEDGHWSPTMEKNPYTCGDTIKGIEGESINFTSDPDVFMLLGRNNGAVWGRQDDGSWSCRHAFFLDWSMHPQISPDGKAIVCKRAFDKNGLWLRQSNGLWDWQRFDFDGENPRFNHDGSLLVIKEATQGVLVFMGPDSEGRWSEKMRARFKGDLDSFDFSRNGHAIQVQYIYDGRKVMLILDITNGDQLAVAPKQTRHDRR